MKTQKKPYYGILALPAFPVVLLTAQRNIMTATAFSFYSFKPPSIMVGIMPENLTYELISREQEFGINIPTKEQLEVIRICGSVSGRDEDKFKKTGLTPEKGKKIKSYLIKECPVNLECVLQQVLEIGAHHLFLGLVVAVHIDNEILDEKGRIDYAKARPFVYLRGEYWNLGKLIGLRHFSTKKS